MKKLIAGLLLVPSIACAEYFSGNKLLEKMRSESAVDRAVAIGYVLGVSDTTQDDKHCSGDTVTSGQTRDVVKKFLEDNPAIRDYSADIITQVALGKTWPCKEKKGSKL